MTSFLTEEEAFKMKHPHYDTIVAWAEGKTIQTRRDEDHTWRDWALDEVAPLFYPDREYRVKPKTIRYRTYLHKALMAGAYDVWNVSEESNEEEPREKWPQFVRWIGDWQEVEI